jgi:thymidylate synthase (FAD)
MRVDYIDHLGSDLTVVNSARVSFDKASGWEETEVEEWEDNILLGPLPYTRKIKTLKEVDKKLINYLAEHNHWSPFAHPQIQLKVKAPVFVARQLQKHVVGLVWNEVSRRYVDDEPEFFTPSEWRGRPTNGAKQGSSGEVKLSRDGDYLYREAERTCLKAYKELMLDGVAPEQARMILPQSMYTEWIWTGSLASYARIYKLRSDSHAQKESQEVAEMLDKIIRPLFPVSWEALT